MLGDDHAHGDHGELHEAYAPKRSARQHKGAAAAMPPVAAAAGESTPAQPPAGGDRDDRPDLPEKAGDRSKYEGLFGDTAVPDAGADTDIRQLSGEDTHFPKDKTPDK